MSSTGNCRSFNICSMALYKYIRMCPGPNPLWCSFFPIPFVTVRMAYICIPEVMGTCSIWPGSEQRRLYVAFLSGKCSSLMTLHLLPIQKKLYSGSSLVSLKLAMSLDSRLVSKKPNIMGQDVTEVPQIRIGDHTLEVVETFTYLGSTIANNLSLDVELSSRIGKASTAMSRL